MFDKYGEICLILNCSIKGNRKCISIDIEANKKVFKSTDRYIAFVYFTNMYLLVLSLLETTALNIGGLKSWGVLTDFLSFFFFLF